MPQNTSTHSVWETLQKQGKETFFKAENWEFAMRLCFLVVIRKSHQCDILNVK